MFLFAPFVGTVALFAGLVSAVPMPDSAVGDEVGVSAPNGVVMSDTSELLAAQTSTWSSSPTGSSYGSYGSSSNNSGSSYGSSADSNTWASSATTTASTTAAMSYSTPSYGSGNSNWGGSGYDSCVQQCVAQFGSPAATYTAPTSTSTDTGSSGGGATHTVIVAPTQGVLRYVPFAINASVGDTVKFVWGANVHTVTKSSALTPCNKTEDAPFASGSQNKSFVFEQVINNTDTTFFYCGTPTHCQKGMFGIINPPSAAGGAMSVGSMMSSMAANDSSVAAMWSYTNNQTSGNNVASSWGGNIDMSSMPAWSHSMVAENVMYNRVFLANNNDVIKADGTVDLSAVGSSPLMIPQDITSVLASNTTATPSSSASAYAAASTSTSNTSPSSSPGSAASTNGASSLRSPGALVALMAITVAAFFTL